MREENVACSDSNRYNVPVISSNNALKIVNARYLILQTRIFLFLYQVNAKNMWSNCQKSVKDLY